MRWAAGDRREPRLSIGVSFYSLGRWIVEEQQQGKSRAKYGQRVIKRLSEALTQRYERGFSEDTLKNARKFYLIYNNRISETVFSLFAIQKSETVFSFFEKEVPFTLPWSHYLQLMRIKDENERKFYEIEATNGAWGIRTLQRQYNSSLYERLALSREKDEVMRLASEGNVIAKPQDIVKQPTVLEFLGLDEKAKYVESDLETAIINKLQKFLLELGKGYLFEARHKRFTFNEDNYYTDVAEEDRVFIAEFYKYGFVGIILDWIDRGMKDDYKEIVRKMGIALYGNIENSIHNFEQINKR